MLQSIFCESQRQRLFCERQLQRLLGAQVVEVQHLHNVVGTPRQPPQNLLFRLEIRAFRLGKQFQNDFAGITGFQLVLRN